jgi:hypothetical protein
MTQLGSHLGGITQGKRNRESGWIQTIGRRQGRKNAKSGHIHKIRTPESTRKGGLATPIDRKITMGLRGLHNRWHVERGISNPKKCAICAKELEHEKNISRKTTGAPIPVASGKNEAGIHDPNAVEAVC